MAEKDTTNQKFNHHGFSNFLGRGLDANATASIVFLIAIYGFTHLAQQMPYISIFPLQAEYLNTAFKLSNFLGKKIPLRVKIPIVITIIGVFLSDLVAMGSSLITKVFMHGAGIFAKLSPISPIMFTAGIIVGGILNTIGLANEAHKYRTKPHTRTNLTKLRLQNKLVKTLGTYLTGGLLLPFLLASGATIIFLFSNPFTAGPTAAVLASLLIAVTVGMFAMKIYKSVKKRQYMSQMINEVINDEINQNKEFGGGYFMEKNIINKRKEDVRAYLNETVAAKEAELDEAKQADKFEIKADINRYYEILRSPDGWKEYNIKRNIANKINTNLKQLGDVKEILGLHDAIQPTQGSSATSVRVFGIKKTTLTKFSFFNWVNYQVKLHQTKSPKDRKKIKNAYTIFSDRDYLYKMYKKPPMAKEKPNKTVSL